MRGNSLTFDDEHHRTALERLPESGVGRLLRRTQRTRAMAIAGEAIEAASAGRLTDCSLRFGTQTSTPGGR